MVKYYLECVDDASSVLPPPKAVAPHMENKIIHSLSMFGAGALALFTCQALSGNLGLSFISPVGRGMDLTSKVEVEGVARLPGTFLRSWLCVIS